MQDNIDIPRKKIEFLYADIIQEIQPLLDQLEASQKASLEASAQSEKLLRKVEHSIPPAIEQIKFSINKAAQQATESIDSDIKSSLLEASKINLNVERSRNNILFLIFFGGAVFGVLGGVFGALILANPILELLS